MKPNVFLLADEGYSTYASTIEARKDTVEKNPDLVQRFIDATAIGWYHYLYGDNTKANEAIKKANPDITATRSLIPTAVLKEHGVINSGDTLMMGIGAMTDARMKDFFDKMVKAGVLQAGPRFQEVLYAANSSTRGWGSINVRNKPVARENPALTVAIRASRSARRGRGRTSDAAFPRPA